MKQATVELLYFLTEPEKSSRRDQAPIGTIRQLVKNLEIAKKMVPQNFQSLIGKTMIGEICSAQSEKTLTDLGDKVAEDDKLGRKLQDADMVVKKGRLRNQNRIKPWQKLKKRK